jgi:hypothetical protein
MALSRWSHSDHYIYDCGENEAGEGMLCVCQLGHFTVGQILDRYKDIDRKAKDDGHGFFSRLELRLYLQSWADFQVGDISFKQYVEKLTLLRRYGIVMTYAKRPWDVSVSDMLRFYFRR